MRRSKTGELDHSKYAAGVVAPMHATQAPREANPLSHMARSDTLDAFNAST